MPNRSAGIGLGAQAVFLGRAYFTGRRSDMKAAPAFIVYIDIKEKLRVGSVSLRYL